MQAPSLQLQDAPRFHALEQVQLAVGLHGGLGVEECPAKKLGFPAEAFCSSP